MGQIVLALHNYESAHGTVPPAVVYGENGRPLYSWRVLILPYIEEEALFKEFHLDEPWDSPHNVRFVERMPISYRGAKWTREMTVPPNHTIIHCFLGPGAAFEGREGLRLEKDFPDGTPNTLFLVEAGAPVPWTKPEEIAYDPSGPVPRPRGPFRDGFRACMADGSRRFVRYDTDEATLRALITRNGGERFAEPPGW